MDKLTVGIDRRIALAAHWYDTGLPPVGVVPHIGLMQEFAAERGEHMGRAEAYATDKTGYPGWTLATALTDECSAWEVIRDCEYGRLEATARERRILALACCLQDATLV
jgi:nicotinic acid phosphoribosyltransferase